MNQNRSIRHHYFPQFLIKNWVDTSGKVWVYNKADSSIFSTSPKDIFVENNLYTWIYGPDFEKSDRVEKQFAAQESRVAKIIKKILKTVRKGMTPILDELEFVELQTFMLAIARRTPAALKEFLAKSPQAFLKREKDRLISEQHLATDTDLTYNEVDVQMVKRITESNACARFAAGDDPELQRQIREYCSNYGLEAFVLTNRNRSILQGSRGYFSVVGLSVERKPFKAARFPIAPDVALAFTHHPHKFRTARMIRSSIEDRYISSINHEVVDASDFIIATNCKLLKKYRELQNRKNKDKA